MRLQELSGAIRAAREARGLTQAALARESGISRETLSLLENGLVRDLGIRKVLALLDHLGLAVKLEPGAAFRQDYVRMSCSTASVSFKEPLTEDELIHALMTGKVPAGRAPHLRALLDDAPEALLRGLVRDVAAWGRPGKVERNLRNLAQALGIPNRVVA